MNNQLKSVRIDKWLCAARFYKTRQLAIKAIKNHQIYLSSQASKPASNITVGDYLTIKSGLYEKEIEVLGLSEKRGSASVAQKLYAETADSIVKRQALKEQLAQQPKVDIDRRKPDKRAIRSHRDFKRNGN